MASEKGISEKGIRKGDFISTVQIVVVLLNKVQAGMYQIMYRTDVNAPRKSAAVSRSPLPVAMA